MKILFLDSSYLQESLLGFFVSFFEHAKIVTSVKHCTKDNEKADIIIISESVLGVDGLLSSNSKESINLSSIKEKAGKPSCKIVGILTRIDGEHPIKNFVAKENIVFINHILTKKGSAIDLFENITPSFSDLYMDCIVELASYDISVGENRIMPFVNSMGDLFSSKELAQLFASLCISAEVYNVLPRDHFTVWVNKFHTFDVGFMKTVDPGVVPDYATRARHREMYMEIVGMLPQAESSFHSACAVGLERARNLMPILSGIENRSKQKILAIDFYIKQIEYRYLKCSKILFPLI